MDPIEPQIIQVENLATFRFQGATNADISIKKLGTGKGRFAGETRALFGDKTINKA